MNFNEISFRVRYAETDQMGIEFTGTVKNKKMNGSVDVGDGMFQMDFEASLASAGAGGEDVASEEPSGDPIEDLIPGRRWVSSLEASRFEAGRVYVTFDGHRSNDGSRYSIIRALQKS